MPYLAMKLNVGPSTRGKCLQVLGYLLLHAVSLYWISYKMPEISTVATHYVVFIQRPRFRHFPLPISVARTAKRRLRECH